MRTDDRSRRLLMLGMVLSTLALGRESAAEAPLVVLDPFESKDAWEVKEWGDPAELSLVTEGAKPTALAVSFDIPSGKGRGKGVIIRRSITGRVGDLGAFSIDVHNPSNQSFDLALALEADRYYELPARRIGPGWNRGVSFSLSEPNAKAETSAWRHEIRMDPKLYVGSLILILHVDGLKKSSITLDDLRSRSSGRPVHASAARVSVEQHAIKLGALVDPPASGALYRRGELRVDLQGKYVDPFDPEEIALFGEFRSPSGKVQRVEGFLYDGEVTGEGPVENADWRLRFTPTEVGAWTYRIVAKNRWSQASVGPYPLEVGPSEARGFVRVDREDPRYFAFDSGAFFYPVGQNVSWGSDEDYARILPRMAESGQNWFRVWMSHWAFGLEWKRMGHYQGLGRYNLANAKRLDALLEKAGGLGLYVQLVFDFHGAFSSKVNPEWQNNPYNVANGGFLDKAGAFFTDPRARALYKRRLRYIVARWGSETHIMAWELFNEVNFVDGFDKEVDAAWHAEMSSHLKAIDPYQHLVTTSYYDDFNKRTSVVESIDYTQYHAYRRRVHKTMMNASLRARELAKPFFFGEFGSDSRDGVDDQDRQGVFLHAGLWSQLMQPAAGGAMPWWWQTHIDPNNLYYHFSALSRFVDGVDRRKLNLQPVRQRLELSMGERKYVVGVMGLQAPELSLFWVCDELGMLSGDRPARLSFEGVRVNLADLADGSYEVEFWNTYTGQVMERTTVVAEGGKAEIALPRFANDVAFKLRKRG